MWWDNQRSSSTGGSFDIVSTTWVLRLASPGEIREVSQGRTGFVKVWMGSLYRFPSDFSTINVTGPSLTKETCISA